ncbi:MAG: CBS domain-containing protein [Candidatus Aenigmatarchaeota archaeon]
MKVKEIMNKKLVFIDVDRNLRDAMKLMERKKISRLLVKDGKKIVGIITERDISERLGSWKERRISDSHIHVSSACTYDLIKIDLNEEVNVAAKTMLEKRISSLVVSDGEEMVGILTKSDLIKVLKNSKIPVEKYMNKTVFSLPLNSSLLQTRKLMMEKGIKRVLIVHEGVVVGIVTERDIAKALGMFRKVVEGKNLDEKMKKISVDTIMSKDVFYVSPKHTLGEVVKIMTENKISGLPVIEEGKVLGIITKTDLIRAISNLKG